MEIDECSINGDSGAEEDEDEELSQDSATESSTNSTESSTTTDSGEESAEEQATTTSESQSSLDEDDEDIEAVEHPEERWETCMAGGTKVKLPQDLCEHASIFKEMLDYPRFWEECLTESQRESLYSHLPTFPKDCNIEAELDKTLDMLFSKELHRFGVNPLDDFHKHLSAGHFRPDIKRMRTLVKKAQRRKYLFEERKRTYELANDLLKSRENLLSSAYKQGFNQSSHRTIPKLQWRKPKPAQLEERAHQRYLEELAAINAEVGATSRLDGTDSDSDDDDGSSCLMTPAQASTGGKLQQQLQLLQQQRRKKRAAMAAQQQQQQQQQMIADRMLLMTPGDETIRPVHSTLSRLGSEYTVAGTSMPVKAELSDERYKVMLLEHKKRRVRKDSHPEMNTQGITLSDIMQRAQFGQKHKLSMSSRVSNTKKRIKIETTQQQPQQQPPPPQPQLQPQAPLLQQQLQPQAPLLQQQLQQQQHQQLQQQQLQQQQFQQYQQQMQQQQQLYLSQQQQQLQQQIQQPPSPIKISPSPIKLESDTNSLTSTEYSIHSVDDLKHNIIEQPDHKPPECLLAADEEMDVKEEPIETIEPAENKYEIEPPSAQLPPDIMDEDADLDYEEEFSPYPQPEIKEEIEDMEVEIKTEEIVPDLTHSLNVNHEIPVSVSIPETDEDLDKKDELDLDSIDMMQLPIQLDDGIDILADVNLMPFRTDDNVITIPEKDVADSIVEDIVMNGDELMQETHMCFFSLLRDAFLSKGEYRMNQSEMTDAVMLWQDNPISPLNDWYSMATSWPELVPFALGFLAGELVFRQDQLLDGDQELVPYLENKGQGVYAWIGAGRDSDSRLSMLCNKFLLYKDLLVPPKPPQPTLTISHKQLSQQVQQSSLLAVNNLESTNAVADIINVTDGLPADPSSPEWEPPKALCPTTWKVQPSTPDEREEFRRQERMRYAAPHKAFTYRMHGYTSVVGPVKGIYQHNAGSGLTKARGHSLLVPDRPNFVTILALVRDATARLPNGEGTRSDICQLLKDSQYIQEDIFNSDKEANLNSVVSGALDRLHYENDPCVRYYPKRKEWLYLHRARSESEFEMYHQQQQGVPKNKKSSGGSSRSKAQSALKANNAKDSTTATTKEPTPKKEKKTATPAKKEQPKKIESEKIVTVVEPSITAAEQLSATVQQQQKPQKIQQQQVALPSISQIVAITTSATPITITMPTMVSVVSTTMVTTSSVSSQTMGTPSVPVASTLTPLPSIATSIPVVEKECPVTVISTVMEPKNQITMTAPRELNSMTTLASALSSPTTVKKLTSNVKPVGVVKSANTQSLLQSNQQHYPHHQIQVSTSAGVQTIRLSGHSVLQSPQPVSPAAATSVASIFPTTSTKVHQQQTVLSTQAGKSLLQTSNLKQQQQQHVMPGKTLLTSQIKLVSSGQIKSLLTGHMQGQTIFIKQSPTASTSQTANQQTQQIQSQMQPRVVTATQQQPTVQNAGMQRIIAQIGGKPVAVQIQQSPQPQNPKVLTKMLTSTSPGQIISMESLLAQKGLKITTTTGHANQLGRPGNKIIQQYQVVSQPQSATGQPKLIVSSPQTQVTVQSPQANPQQTVRMVTAQLAGKPIVLASSGTGKPGAVVLGKQTTTGQQQPIVLPSQLLNIKTLQGIKVISTPTGLKTAGSAVYTRVIAPTSITQTNQSNVVTVQTQQPQQPPQQQPNTQQPM